MRHITREDVAKGVRVVLARDTSLGGTLTGSSEEKDGTFFVGIRWNGMQTDGGCNAVWLKLKPAD